MTASQLKQDLREGSKAPQGLREARVNWGFSQEQVAEALGVTPIHVSRWETGARKVSLLDALRLAAFYETTVEDLFGYLLKEGKE